MPTEREPTKAAPGVAKAEPELPGKDYHPAETPYRTSGRPRPSTSPAAVPGKSTGSKRWGFWNFVARWLLILVFGLPELGVGLLVLLKAEGDENAILFLILFGPLLILIVLLIALMCGDNDVSENPDDPRTSRTPRRRPVADGRIGRRLQSQ
jgi:hypothetical protein